jgi:hypothetical protein
LNSSCCTSFDGGSGGCLRALAECFVSSTCTERGTGASATTAGLGLGGDDLLGGVSKTNFNKGRNQLEKRTSSRLLSIIELEMLLGELKYL